MEKESKLVDWMKKYGTYAVAGFLVVAMALAVLLTGINSDVKQETLNTSAKNPVVSVNTTPINFSMPMLNATLVKDFSTEELYLNSTLGRWEFHDGIDLTSSDLKVFSVADGIVTSIENTSLEGTVITISHGKNLSSQYGSLADSVLVAVGDKVKAGDQIGSADKTRGSEENDGKHLHFVMLEDGKKIDPANYLEFEVK